MTVEDVLVGEKSVIVETSDKEYRFEKKSDSSVKAPNDIPDEVENALIENGFDLTEFPVQMKHYIHDEAAPHVYTEIAEDLRMDEDADIVRRIANIGYEVEFTIEVEDEDTAYVTHVDGHELKERKKIH